MSETLEKIAETWAALVRVPCRVILAAVLLSLSACAKMPLYADLDEKEANQMAAALMEQGVECTKLPGAEGKWSLEVAQDDFAYAMAVLEAKELPRQKFQKLSEVFPKGTFSSPSEDHYRYVDVREQQLSEAILTNFSAVMSVQVKLSLPEPEPLSDEVVESKASVILKYRPDFDFEMIETDLKNVVSNSVDSLDPENVKVLAMPAEVVMPPKRLEPENPVMDKVESLPPLSLAGISAVVGALVAVAIALIFRRKTPPAAAKS